MRSSNMTIDFCLLIPCFNNSEGLLTSLKTVHYKPNQFLVVVVDDGSVNPLNQDVITTELGVDFPVTVIRSKTNIGITKALNLGIRWIQENVNARYIARLDCGDLCKDDRFDKQVQFLDAHGEIGLLGSWCRFVDEETGKEYRYKGPGNHQQIAKAMYFRNVFMHATVMFRLSTLSQTGNYPEGFELVEDYAFFWEFVNRSQVAMLQEELVVCKVNKSGISFQNRGKQLNARWLVVKKFASNQFLKVQAFIRLKLLLLLPNEVALWLKMWKR